MAEGPAVEVAVDVGEPSASPAGPPSGGPVVVVAPPSDDNGTSEVSADIIERVTRLEDRLYAVEERTAVAIAEVAATVEEASEEAVEQAEAAAEEVVEEAVEEAETEPDNPPIKPHFLHRSFHDLVGRQ